MPVEVRASAVRTERLMLTPITVEDADAMTTVLAHPELYRFTGGEPPGTGDLRERYARQVAGSGREDEVWLNWIVRLATTEPIGYLQAEVVGDTDERVGWLAWVIGRRWQRLGYATEAAQGIIDWLRARGIEVFTAKMHADNVASIGVARHLGLAKTDETVAGEDVWRLSTSHATQ